MAKPREELQMLLEELLGSRSVYFQPPESVKLNYPCIIYERSGERVIRADNLPFFKDYQYTITVVCEDPEPEILDKLSELPYCRFDRHFISDNLNHDVFTIFY